ncbi:MAG: hypothetical protein LJE95_14700 [Acidobacteria bacterium]|jgi:hypothetical protein|nr:hypothetical protein [Acidobacteriota bacterium]
MRRFLAVLLVLVLIVAGGGYLWLQHRHTLEMERLTAETNSQLTQARTRYLAVAQDLAEDAAGALAVTLAGDIARQEYAAIDAELGTVVQGHRLTGIIVLGQDGKVLSATDLRYRGRTLDDPATKRALAVNETVTAAEAPQPGQIEVDSPVFSGGQRLATLRVFVDITASEATTAAE